MFKYTGVGKKSQWLEFAGVIVLGLMTVGVVHTARSDMVHSWAPGVIMGLGWCIGRSLHRAEIKARGREQAEKLSSMRSSP